jgi:putative phosphoesterase
MRAAQSSWKALDYPLQIFEAQGIRFGMCHGEQVMPKGNEDALDALRRRMGVDVLLTGGTGRSKFTVRSGGVLVDPGSITGAHVSHLATGQASYTLLLVDNGKVCIWGSSGKMTTAAISCTR